MEALLQSGLATKAGLPIADQEADPTPEATITALEKDMSNLVLNDAGEQKYIGKSPTLSHVEISLLMRIMIRAFVRVQLVLTAVTSLGKFKIIEVLSCDSIAIFMLWLTKLQMSHKLGSPRMLNLFTRLHRQGFIWPTARFEGKWDGQFRRSPLPSKQAAVYLVDRMCWSFFTHTTLWH